MTAREKILAGVAGTILAGGGVGVGGYVGLVKPVLDNRADAKRLTQEADDKRFQLALLRKKLAQLPAVYAKSLPADPAVAKLEYEAALSRVLSEAKVPRGGYTVVPAAPDARPVPELTPKVGSTPAVPAYQRIAFNISMKPVGLDTLTDVLERYHKLGLLHQITKLTVKRLENQGSAANRRGTVGSRADLDVTLTTEAIILDGADPRRTLRPVPYAPGALVGSAGLHHLTQTPDLGRAVPTPAVPSGLATTVREYVAMLAKNPFHGPLPPPVPPPPPPPPPVEVPLEDISAFVKLNAIIRSSDGHARADIKDTANNLDYTIDIAVKNGVPAAKVEKFYYLKDRKKKLDSGTELHISDDSSGTDRTFQVVGIDANGTDLVLTAVPAPAAEKERPARGAKPGVPPAAAVAGGLALGVPPRSRVYIWPAGQSLKAVRELSAAEGMKAVERVRDGATVPAATPVSRPPAN